MDCRYFKLMLHKQIINKSDQLVRLWKSLTADYIHFGLFIQQIHYILWRFYVEARIDSSSFSYGTSIILTLHSDWITPSTNCYENVKIWTLLLWNFVKSKIVWENEHIITLNLAYTSTTSSACTLAINNNREYMYLFALIYVCMCAWLNKYKPWSYVYIFTWICICISVCESICFQMRSRGGGGKSLHGYRNAKDSTKVSLLYSTGIY